METVRPATQNLGRPVRILGWGDCYLAAAKLWDRIKVDPPRLLYGVPRGGCTAAALIQTLALQDGHKLILVDQPSDEEQTLVVDDLVDSGATLRRFSAIGHRVDALFRKLTSPLDLAPEAIEVPGWLTFPWEVGLGTGAEDLVVRLLQFIGEDPARDGLKETPTRVLKAWKELTAGYAQDPKVILNKSFEQPHDELVMLRGIEFHSTCEHHLLPFYGTAAVGYIPTTSVVGISKLARLVDCFAKRLQIQERLTKQIADAITEVLAPVGVGVVIKAKHSCMGCRGVMKPDSDMVTSVMLGMLRDNSAARAEFLSLVNL